MMNTQQIDYIIRRHVRGFDGVFSSNTLPPDNPRLLVANTQPSDQPGEHWISIYVDRNGDGKYFDSFSRPPSRNFKDYLDKHCKSWTYNSTQLQSIASKLCGQYCVVWCIFIRKKADLCNLLSSSDTGLNDSIISHIVSRLI